MNGADCLLLLGCALALIALFVRARVNREPPSWTDTRYHDHMIDTTPQPRRGRWL